MLRSGTPRRPFPGEECGGPIETHPPPLILIDCEEETNGVDRLRCGYRLEGEGVRGNLKGLAS
jgi:hypothetical protein